MLGEMWQRSRLKTELDTLSLNILLADTAHDLRDINVRSFTACIDHVCHLVVATQVAERELTCFRSRCVQLFVDAILETFHHSFTGHALQKAKLSLIANFLNLLHVSVYRSAYFRLCLWLGYCIHYADCVPVKDQPLIQNVLASAEESTAYERAALLVYYVNQASSRRTNYRLVEHTAQQRASLYYYI